MQALLKNQFHEAVWSEETLNQILSSARWYASGDNIQPFRFRYVESGVEIFCAREHGENFMNPNEIATFVSLGFCLEALEATAESMGWKLAGNLTLENVFNDQPIGTLKVSECTPNPDAVEPVLSRRTSRLDYYPQAKFKNKKTESAIRSISYGKMRMHLIDQPALASLKVIAQCDDLLMDPRVMRNLLHYTDMKGRSPVGFLPSNLGLSLPEKLTFGLAQLLGLKFGPYVFSWPANHIAIFKSLRGLKSSPYLMLCSGPKPEKHSDWVAIGRCVAKAWGEVGVAGFCAQAISTATLTYRTFESAGKLPLLKKSLQKRMKTADLEIKKLFQLPDNEVPLWLFRVGTDGTSTDPDRLRLKVEEIKK